MLRELDKLIGEVFFAFACDTHKVKEDTVQQGLTEDGTYFYLVEIEGKQISVQIRKD